MIRTKYQLFSFVKALHYKRTVPLYVTTQGVPKSLLESGEQYIVSRFSSVFSGCLTRGIIYTAKIVLFKFYN